MQRTPPQSPLTTPASTTNKFSLSNHLNYNPTHKDNFVTLVNYLNVVLRHTKLTKIEEENNLQPTLENYRRNSNVVEDLHKYEGERPYRIVDKNIKDFLKNECGIEP